MAGSKKSERVTIRTVAKDAGVSVAAVSKVLRDAYGVSEGLRTKVLASMQALGYRPHTAARGMRGQTYTLGVLLPDLRNPFFADIVAGIDEALVRTQYQPLLGLGHASGTTEHALVDAMVDRQIDGMILIAPRIPTDELKRIAGYIPTAIIGLHVPDAQDSIPSTTTTCLAARWRFVTCTIWAIATSRSCRWIFRYTLLNAKPLPCGRRAIARR